MFKSHVRRQWRQCAKKMLKNNVEKFCSKKVLKTVSKTVSKIVGHVENEGGAGMSMFNKCYVEVELCQLCRFMQIYAHVELCQEIMQM